MAVPPQKFTFRMAVPTVPGKPDKIMTDAFEATPREAAKFATDSIARSGGMYRSVVVSMNGSEVMRCDYGIYRKSERARARRGSVVDSGVARCTISPGFKQLLVKPKRKRRK